MKRLLVFLCLCALLFTACAAENHAQVAATTLPVYEFTTILCENTDITVTRLITENVSCLHDSTVKVDQMQAIEGAQLLLINGAGLEGFMESALEKANSVGDASEGLALLHGQEHDYDHGDHVHEDDPHIWLSPNNAKHMAENLYSALCAAFPQWETTFRANLTWLLSRLDDLQNYGEEALSNLRCRELITFHDGFTYLAESFDLTILHAIEEESGAEASAAELIELIGEVHSHELPAIFTESNGSVSAANIIAAETGVKVYALDMGISGTSYFDAMYCNINTLKEALQ